MRRALSRNDEWSEHDGPANRSGAVLDDANIERILKENTDLNQEKVIALLSNFNTFNIQYDQLCHNLITFIKIFQPDKQEIRIYKTEDLIELLEANVNEVSN